MTHFFKLGDIALENGGVLPNAQLAYSVFGTLNADRTNAILLNTPFPARDDELEWFIGPDHALNPATYCIIVPNLFGNGRSSSPSNMGAAVANGSYPLVTVYDNVVQQRRLIREEFGIERLCLVTGYSLGGQQAYQWAALYPDRVERLAAICTSAQTSEHNRVFLLSVLSALTADHAWQDGWFATRPDRGLKAVAHAFAAWGISQTFYRRRMFETLGFASVETFLAETVEPFFLSRDANDLVAMLQTWLHADISANGRFGGSLKAALGAIRCKALVMPSTTDLYFTLEDSEAEVALMPNAALLPIPSVWGHRAGNPRQNPEDAAFLDHALNRLLASC